MEQGNKPNFLYTPIEVEGLEYSLRTHYPRIYYFNQEYAKNHNRSIGHPELLTCVNMFWNKTSEQILRHNTSLALLKFIARPRAGKSWVIQRHIKRLLEYRIAKLESENKGLIRSPIYLHTLHVDTVQNEVKEFIDKLQRERLEKLDPTLVNALYIFLPFPEFAGLYTPEQIRDRLLSYKPRAKEPYSNEFMGIINALVRHRIRWYIDDTIWAGRANRPLAHHIVVYDGLGGQIGHANDHDEIDEQDILGARNYDSFISRDLTRGEPPFQHVEIEEVTRAVVGLIAGPNLHIAAELRLLLQDLVREIEQLPPSQRRKRRLFEEASEITEAFGLPAIRSRDQLNILSEGGSRHQINEADRTTDVVIHRLLDRLDVPVELQTIAQWSNRAPQAMDALVKTLQVEDVSPTDAVSFVFDAKDTDTYDTPYATVFSPALWQLLHRTVRNAQVINTDPGGLVSRLVHDLISGEFLHQAARDVNNYCLAMTDPSLHNIDLKKLHEIERRRRKSS